MGEVVVLRRPRKQTIRGAAREAMTQAVRTIAKPAAVVVVVLAKDGSFALRSVNIREEIADFDMYSRVAAVCDRERMGLLE